MEGVAAVARQRILVVEDTKNIAMAVSFCLQGAGYDATVVEDGVTALASISESPPDLVLLDLVLPRMNGFLVLEALKQDAQMREVPVVVLSARADDRDIERARALGAREYLVKPFTPHDLLRVVRDVLTKEGAHA